MGAPPAPFVRFSRDKRGYESVYLVHVSGRPPRPRVLYWFRTAPGVKLGRSPFDDKVQKALEAQYPDLRFDWKRITEAQPPPVSEGEHWRERRRAERSAKQARQAAMRERAEFDQPQSNGAKADAEDVEVAAQEAGDLSAPADAPEQILDISADSDSELTEGAASDEEGETESGEAADALGADAPTGSAAQAGECASAPRRRRRRRRRGGRGRNRSGAPASEGTAPTDPAGDQPPVSLAGGEPRGPDPEPAEPDPGFRAEAQSSEEEPTS